MIDGIQIVVDRCDRFDLQVLLGDHLVEQQIEIVRPARFDKQALAVVRGFAPRRCTRVRTVAPPEPAGGRSGSGSGSDVRRSRRGRRALRLRRRRSRCARSTTLSDIMSTSCRMWLEMMRYIPASASWRNRRIISARAIGSRPFSGSSRTSTDGLCAIDCASRTRCRIPLLNAETLRSAASSHRHAFERLLRQLVGLLFRVAVNAQIEFDKFACRRSTRERVELRAVTELLKDSLGFVRRHAEDAYLAPASA